MRICAVGGRLAGRNIFMHGTRPWHVTQHPQAERPPCTGRQCDFCMHRVQLTDALLRTCRRHQRHSRGSRYRLRRRRRRRRRRRHNSS